MTAIKRIIAFSGMLVVLGACTPPLQPVQPKELPVIDEQLAAKIIADGTGEPDSVEVQEEEGRVYVVVRWGTDVRIYEETHGEWREIPTITVVIQGEGT